MTLDIRVLDLGLQSGTYNTAIDSVIQLEVAEGKSPATILYTTWKPTVSAGISQNISLDVGADACKKYGIEIVRRKSGGQSVYLDEEYIVYSVIAPREKFPADVTHLCHTFCDAVIKSLTAHGVPASFYPHGNIVIKDEHNAQQSQQFRQIGNSGQMIAQKAVVVHGSIRYARQNLPTMIRSLNINKHSLVPYEADILHVLASVDEYSRVSRSELINELSQSFANYLGGKPVTGQLTQAETLAMKNPQFYLANIADDAHFGAKGVCYLDMNGHHLVPSLAKLLPEKIRTN